MEASADSHHERQRKERKEEPKLVDEGVGSHTMRRGRMRCVMRQSDGGGRGRVALRSGCGREDERAEGRWNQGEDEDEEEEERRRIEDEESARGPRGHESMSLFGERSLEE